jgi:DNA-3-methyladenine glycosylase
MRTQRRSRGQTGPVLARDFYDRYVIEVARALLGKTLLRRTADGLTAGRIVETEAYLAADDPACHAFRGLTRRNASMFGPPGHAYVYAIHSRWCLNIVTEAEGVPSAVLVRAIEPMAGLELMRARRTARAARLADNGRSRALPDRDLARGPGRLCEALAIDRRLDGWDLVLGRELWLENAGVSPAEAVVATRIGVSSGHELPLRFYEARNPFVSRG